MVDRYSGLPGGAMPLPWISTALFVLLAGYAKYVTSSKECDRVHYLPGSDANLYHFDQYAGYVTVNQSAGRALFYWFTQATHDPASKPLVLWLNGGPGCSSIAYGAMQELGPYRITKSGLSHNKFSWNRVANVLFLESPAGVGFSYSNTSSDLKFPGDKNTARDSYIFLERWLERFPEYKKRDFYITGESYAGHYVPQLANVIYNKNKKKENPDINLKGFMVGNALLDHEKDRIGRVDFWWSHALISHNTYRSIVRYCNLKGETNGTQDQCSKIVLYAYQHEFGTMDRYNIYAPVCLRASSSQRTFTRFFSDPVSRIYQYSGYDPCGDDYVEVYFNRPDVQQALHANVTGIPYNWTGCSETINTNWQDSDETMLPIYRKLMKAGLRIWVYSGDVDSVVPVTSSRYSVEKLKLNTTKPWYPWYRNKQVGGYTEIYDGLAFVTVRGAGHEVPMFQPGRAFTLIKSFLAGKPMPSGDSKSHKVRE
ncbi:serine carboxypeptidase 24 isoform X2 [Selaginella moellendorffii]|uniref:serine carboxypeptidase 24 isoform X2 n=1 Tax=Selaginella moellendorffii TaxID=88036 RepID=UPI000D1C470B|nr:serine carboxypeptidase 24 isoform X2 [Selaginella moellendorffii]XP_024530919.1 serine carboxypeptidase 24 isoform X2 [Selaginella moellendorffii]|eukprot:XP_024530915.1 serine carboxypeptidase 24 isoform X2 [Selaginella moellendorffii]